MKRIRTSLAAIWSALLLVTPAWSEILPVWPLEYATLEAHLIVEGRRTGDANVVRVEAVQFGPAEVGDTIRVDGLDDLPMVAHKDFRRFASKEEDGIPVGDALGMFFLVRQEGRDAVRPFGWGSGVKWLLNDGVYGYTQADNPGPYVLVPEEAATLQSLRAAITAGLQKRRPFDDALRDPNPHRRAQQLAAFIRPEQPYYYFGKAAEALAALGHEGALIFQRQAVRPEQKKRRHDLLIAIGRSKDKRAVPFLVDVIKQSRPFLDDAAVPFVWPRVSGQEREAMLDWRAAVYSLSEIGDESALPELRNAATWGAIHHEREMVEHGVRGMAKTPTVENLPCFRSVFAALPQDAEGIGKWSRYATLLALIEHKYLDAAPLFISQLNQPDIFVYAVRGLKELSGKDLGILPGPWLKWYEDQKQQER